MANLFNFKRSLFGFRKKDVLDHIDNMNSIHSRKIKEKERQNKDLQDKYNEMERKYNEASLALATLKDEKEATLQALTSVLNDLAVSKNELAACKNSLKELEELKLEKDELLAEKEKIAQAWIVSAEKAEAMIADARENAESIINEAIITSESEKKAIEVKIDNEREKLIDIKREMRDLKNSFVSMLQKYGEEIESKIEDIDEEEAVLEEEEIAVDLLVEEEELGIAVPDLPYGFGRAVRPREEESNNVLSFVDYIEEDDDSSTPLL